MMRAIKLSVALLLAACMLSGCYVYHQEGGQPDGPSGPEQQQQQQQKGVY